MKIPVRMVADVVKTPLPIVTMAAVWMVLTLPVSVFWDSLGILVLSISVNVKWLHVRMGNVKIPSMLFSAFAI